MSTDLLREFGDPQGETWTRAQVQTVESTQGPEDDDFGEFEDPKAPEIITGQSVVPQTSSVNQQLLSSYENPVSSACSEVGREPEDVSRRGIKSQLNDDNAWGDFNDTTVLFDAEQLNDNGPNHEGHSNSRQSQTDNFVAEQPMRVSLHPIDSREAISRRAKVLPTDPYNDDQEENWEPIIAEHNAVLPASIITPTAPSLTTNVGIQTTSTVQTKDMGPPPSNIPPPSMLLSLITKLFHLLPGELRDIISQARASSYSNEALNQPHIDQIKAVFSIAKVAARIIAGRKLRWKRDNLLSQSMKIGLAGKPGGMKLTGVDKTESRREDQETAEALSVWRKQVGSLRSTVSMVNSHLPRSGLAVPEISENMPIRVMKPSEGAVTAPKCCFLCGIKRDERVAKVDLDVEDSFGEFWTEHWGHVDCVALWETQKHTLPQR